MHFYLTKTPENKMISTIIVIDTTDQTFRIPGTFTAEQVVAQYGDSIEGLRSLEATTEVLDNGDTKITFRKKVGTKG